MAEELFGEIVPAFAGVPTDLEHSERFIPLRLRDFYSVRLFPSFFVLSVQRGH